MFSATRILREISTEIECVEPHVILLKCLSDANDVESAVQHVMWIREKSPQTVEFLLTQLVESLSTAPKMEHVLELLRALSEKGFVIGHIRL